MIFLPMYIMPIRRSVSGGRRSRRRSVSGGRRSKSRSVSGGRRKSKGKSSGKKRKINEYFRLMLDAKKKNKSPFNIKVRHMNNVQHLLE